MALGVINGVEILGIAAAVPKNSVSNRDADFLSEADCAKLIKMTGIERRRVAPLGMCASDLCQKSAERLMADMGWTSDSIDALIFVSQTPDYRLPATSCLLQERLQLPKTCLTLDISLGCSGYIYGMATLAGLVSSLKLRRALLLVGDLTAQTVSPCDRSATPLFGDAGSATALGFLPQASPLFIDLNTDGSGANAILMPGGGYRTKLTAEDLELKSVSEGIARCALNTVLDGAAVFNFTLREVPPSVRRAMTLAKVTEEMIDWFIMHQANLFMNEQIRKKLNIPVEKHPYSLKEFGNTSCATLPLTLVSQCREQLNNRPNKVLLSGFGVGLSWGTIIADFPSKFVCSKLIELS